jgi:predicted O-linked N-acetylglucosamine transferase (SPINDLY family)
MPGDPPINHPTAPPPSSAALEASLAEAVQFQLAGQLDRAEPLYRAILETQPRHAAANHCLGMLQVQRGRPADGLTLLFAALEASPQTADYWLGYLEALLLAGQIAGAQAALALARERGLKGEAVDGFAKRLADKSGDPSSPAGADARGAGADARWVGADARVDDRLLVQQERQLQTLLTQGQFSAARQLARSMTERFPQSGAGWKVLGALLWAEDKIPEALTAMRTAARLMPQDAETHTNLGVTLSKLERYPEAETYLRRALEIDPGFAAAHVHLGNWFLNQGRYTEAEASLRKGTAAESKAGGLDRDLRHSSLGFVLSHNPAMDPAALFAEHCRIGAILEAGTQGSWPRHRNTREPDRRLKVGWVSGDLCNHSVAYFLEPVLAQLQNHPSLQLHAYYNNPVEDTVTRRLQGYFAHWRAVAALSDLELARQITDDGIDVLIDLSGHTSLNRLHSFARKPAPVQASWIGYPGTTGLRAMDYYVADPHFLPPGQFDAQFTEKLVYLPANVPFQPYEAAPPVNALPALTSGSMTFGSFNRLGKINAATIALWSQLLRALPGSRLLVGGLPRDGRESVLLDGFAGESIGRERLSLHYRDTMDAYLALHHQVDLCLDTYPYSGGTTTIHALWMGIPTLTVAGATPAGRQGAAVLGQLGLDEFVAADPADFLAKGIHWVRHAGALAQVRAGLRERWQHSPARKPELVANSLETAIRRMWTRWCAGQPPESFQIF